jgi:hypothetical protein
VIAAPKDVYEARDRAAEVFTMNGARVPEPGTGEGLTAYRQRLLSNLTRYAPPPLNHLEPWRLAADSLAPFEEKMITGAIAEFKKPVGPLRELVTYDDSNRPLRQFFGDPEYCWGRFKPPSRIVTGWDTDLARGKNAVGAIVPVQQVMSDGSVRAVPA